MLIRKKEHLQHRIACQEKLQDLGALALEVVEALLTDTETPIEIRLSTAFRIVEMCAKDSNKEIGQAIISGIEDNAKQIEKNACELATLESLLRNNNNSSSLNHEEFVTAPVDAIVDENNNHLNRPLM
ncbi:MAG: hypothetical protein KAH84_12195 [Thiomargarita sp.]|nr:hypothetical protein [Thiomargarita sp.]